MQNQGRSLPPLTNQFIRKCLMNPRKRSLHPSWGVTNDYVVHTLNGVRLDRLRRIAKWKRIGFWLLILGGLVLFADVVVYFTLLLEPSSLPMLLLIIGCGMCAAAILLFILHALLFGWYTNGKGDSQIVKDGAWEVRLCRVTDKRSQMAQFNIFEDDYDVSSLDVFDYGVGTGREHSNLAYIPALKFSGFYYPVGVNWLVYFLTRVGRPVYVVYNKDEIYAFFFADRFGGYVGDGQREAIGVYSGPVTYY